MKLFKNCTVVDGTGAPSFRAHILVKDCKISKIIKSDQDIPLLESTEVFDLNGKILCPGFMDIHAHSDLEVKRNPSMNHKIQQGITFDLSGNCGAGVFPRKTNAKEAFAEILGHYPNWNWTDFDSYKKDIKTAMDIGFLQCHSMLRMTAIEGNPNKKATKKEIIKMVSLLEESFSQGTFGFSTGLYYAPCLFASKDELNELLMATKANNKIFTVHHRCEGDEVLTSLDEIINLVKPIGVKTEISHLKAIGRNNQIHVKAMLQKIHQARDNGLDIAFDQYPYEYGSTSLFSLLPPSLLRLEQKDLLAELRNLLDDKQKKDKVIEQMLYPQGWDSIAELCSWEDISIVSLGCNPSFNGKSIAQIAQILNKTPFDTLFYLLSQETQCALMADVTQSIESLETIMKDELMAFGTDALYTGSTAHPRSGNATVHFLSEYVYKRKTLTIEEAIAKMTSKVASRLNLVDVGQIQEGYRANLVIFDPMTLKDNSSLDNPYSPCDGIIHVLVNGEFAIKNSVLTNSLSGRLQPIRV